MIYLRFYFEFAHVCLLINAGEITVVEYGADGPLGWVRTELTNPHLLRYLFFIKNIAELE